METWNDRLLARVKRAIRVFAPDEDSLEEMMQLARIELARLAREGPHNTESWYVQGCVFHVQHWLEKGRSIDSLKRKCLGCPIEDLLGDGECPIMSCLVDPWSPRDEASVRDFVEALHRRLNPPQLEVLALAACGYPDLEIARRMGVSHTTVRKRRQEIAAAARALGVAG